jgi:hypothetical protein
MGEREIVLQCLGRSVAIYTGCGLCNGYGFICRVFSLGTLRPIYRTATPLPSKNPNLYIFSTNLRTKFFKHAAHSPFFPLQNAFHFIMLHYLVTSLFAFYIQGVLKIKCQIPVPQG